MSTATLAFGSRPVRRQRSTTVRPRQSADSQSTWTLSRSQLEQLGADHLGDARPRRGPASRRTRRSRGGRCRRSRAARRRSARRGRRPRSCSACARLSSARCVTSRPTIVTSRPLAKTRAAASGSAQMLNSAAGVTLPSAIAPPISTIRSGSRLRMTREQERDVRERAGGDERASPAMRSARKSTACSPSGAACGGGRSGPSRPVSPWTSAATERSRTSGRSAPAATGDVSPADELEHADRVRGRLLERLVAGDRRHAEQLDLRAREREQERDRVVMAGVAVEQDRRASCS